MKTKFLLILAAVTFNGFLSAQAANGPSCHILDKQLDNALHDMFNFAQAQTLKIPAAPAQNLEVPGCTDDQVKTALKISYQKSHDQKYRDLVTAYFRQQPKAAPITTAEVPVRGAGAY
jgi:hypothetical protein